MGILDVAILNLNYQRLIDVVITPTLAHDLHEPSSAFSASASSLRYVPLPPDVLPRLPDAAQNDTPLSHILSHSS